MSETPKNTTYSVTRKLYKFRRVNTLRTPALKASQKGLFFSLFSILLVFSFFISATNCHPLTTTSPKPEEGRAHINRVICTNTGLCLIFFYRTKAPSDVGEINGPYVKAAYLTSSGYLTNLSSSINLIMNADIINDMDVYEVQEEGDLFRLIGCEDKVLYEIWWFKSNNSAVVKEKDLEGDIEWGERETHHQWPHVNQIRNYTLVGLGRPVSSNKLYQFIKIDMERVERIPIQVTSEQFNEPRYYLFDGADSFFTFDYLDEFQLNQLLIRRLFLNGTFYDYMTLDLVRTNRRWYYYFIGEDHNPYLGIRSFDPLWEDYSLDQYTHTFFLVNLTSKQIITHSFVSQDNSYAWDVLIDSESNIHVILNTYTSTQYLKFSQNGVIDVNSTLVFPETGRFHIPSDSFALYQDQYLLGGLEKENRNAGVFVIDRNTGKVVSVNGSLIPFIDYPKDFFGYFGFFVLLPGLIAISVFRRTRRRLK